YSGSNGYTVSSASLVNNGQINLGVSGIIASGKTYDGTVTATIDTSSATLLGGVTVNGTPGTPDYSSVTGSFASKEAGTENITGLSGLSFTGVTYTGSGTLTLTPTSTVQGVISQKQLSGITVSKVYDGTTTISSSNVSGTISTEAVGAGNTSDGKAYTGDDVSINASGATGTYTDDQHVGTGKPVTFTSGLTLSGSNAGDYTLTGGAITGTITAKTLNISGATATKVYDGSNTVTSVTGAGLLTAEAVGTGTSSDGKPYSGDTIGFGGSLTSGTFGSVHTSATMASLSGYTISDTDYTLSGAITNGINSNTVSITAKALTITATSQTKTYGDSNLGTTAFTTTPLVGAEAIGSVSLTSLDATLSGSGNYNISALGTPWTITPSGATGGTFTASDYAITYNTGTLTINPAALTVTATGVNKIFDGTSLATVTLSDNRVSGDHVTDSYTSAVFTSSTAGQNVPITVTGISIAGTDAANYLLSNTTATAYANVTSNVENSQLDNNIVTTPGVNTTIMQNFINNTSNIFNTSNTSNIDFSSDNLMYMPNSIYDNVQDITIIDLL
ncbi:MAG: hypothetical protein HQL13_08155, partial [Candidatus Omnitrophica bacterium]|nr:hypothetical protein [Candidatus Omnitrophota bacterium]